MTITWLSLLRCCYLTQENLNPSLQKKVPTHTIKTVNKHMYSTPARTSTRCNNMFITVKKAEHRDTFHT